MYVQKQFAPSDPYFLLTSSVALLLVPVYPLPGGRTSPWGEGPSPPPTRDPTNGARRLSNFVPDVVYDAVQSSLDQMSEFYEVKVPES